MKICDLEVNQEKLICAKEKGQVVCTCPYFIL
jgi:hypothetical protein